ncbi:MAG: hypothetical protein CBD18_06035 [Opitutales bacterium TMED158]|nr:MAG: hypothetical protein CBD18_06035 [Opitutales bacterium TMED158]
MKTFIATAIFSLVAVNAAQAQCEHCVANAQAKDGSQIECKDSTLAAYFEIQKALANDDFSGAKAVAGTLSEKVDSNTCYIDEKDCCEAIKRASTAIAAAKDVSIAREAFKTFSGALIARLDAQGDSEIAVYKMHCPMAFGNTGGTWLQDGPDLRNPYYGAMMLKCGMQQAVYGKE